MTVVDKLTAEKLFISYFMTDLCMLRAHENSNSHKYELLYKIIYLKFNNLT